jgi:hypothetical protein
MDLSWYDGDEQLGWGIQLDWQKVVLMAGKIPRITERTREKMGEVGCMVRATTEAIDTEQRRLAGGPSGATARECRDYSMGA